MQNQDLRFAAESIQRIAEQAIRSIEMLYSQNSSHGHPYQHVNPPSTPYVNPMSTPQVTQPAQPEQSVNHQYVPSNTYSYDDTISDNRPKVHTMMEIPSLDRPQKIDNDLHNLTL